MYGLPMGKIKCPGVEWFISLHPFLHALLCLTLLGLLAGQDGTGGGLMPWLRAGSKVMLVTGPMPLKWPGGALKAGKGPECL